MHLGRNTVIRETLGVESLLLMVDKAQLRWCGYVMRMAPDRMAMIIITAVPDERRPVDRLRVRLMDQVNECCADEWDSKDQGGLENE